MEHSSYRLGMISKTKFFRRVRDLPVKMEVLMCHWWYRRAEVDLIFEYLKRIASRIADRMKMAFT